MASRWAESALTWWEDAGVDTIVGEEPRDWLAGPKKPAASPAQDRRPTPPASPAGLPSSRTGRRRQVTPPLAAPAPGARPPQAARGPGRVRSPTLPLRGK